MRWTAPLFVALGMVSCVNVNSERVLTGTPSAAYGGNVKVVMDESPVGGEYEEVAIVSATGNGNGASLPAVIGALQSQAASLGCNAVIRVRYDRGADSATATGVAVRPK